MEIKLIVTHPGGAHKDDFLACCLLGYLHSVPIHRREPNEDEIGDPAICVVDVGGSHDPQLNNFDHHQFPRDAPPQCALSLVLLSLGLYEDALSFCAWLRPAEWLDTLGPNEASRLMGIPRTALSELNSPIDIALLNRFASNPVVAPNSVLHQVMCMVGEDILEYLRSLRQRLNFLKQHAQWWEIETNIPDKTPVRVLFLEQTKELATDPSFGLYNFISEQEQEDNIHALVYPDRRGNGYGLTTYDDCPLLDFSLIEEENDVRFAHKRGFVAKVEATEPARLKELVALAAVN